MRIPVALTLVLLLSACGASAPTRTHVPANKPASALAVIKFHTAEVQPVGLDGAPITDRDFWGGTRIFVEPGRHIIHVALDWEVMTPGLAFNLQSSDVKYVCVDAKPGTEYLVRAEKSRQDWRPLISELNSAWLSAGLLVTGAEAGCSESSKPV
jgi:hypothetical protein